MIIERRRLVRAAALLAAALVAGGCQGLSGPGAPGIDLDRAMPGELARERHAHVTAAIRTLGAALAGPDVGLDGVLLDADLVDASAPGTTAETPTEATRRLAERELMDAGPYRLVGADAAGGRLEYRSGRTRNHLSVTVREPTASERADGDAFVVTDVFGQASLAALVRDAGPGGRGDGAVPVAIPTALSTALSTGRPPAGDDAATLAWLDALPRVEREREDLLGLRALLAVRLGRDERALPLVESGIVRYPDSALHFALAERLFERADPDAGVPASLVRTVRERFDRREIDAARRTVERFVAGGPGA